MSKSILLKKLGQLLPQMKSKHVSLWVASLLSGLLCGCYSAKNSEPPRTATEQLLLSRAADQAMAPVDLSWLQGKKIFVEEKYFESYDKGYAMSLIRQHLSANGALIMKTDDKAEVIVEIRSGALSMNTSETFFGLPSFAIPVPLSGPVQTPEIAFYKSQLSDGLAKFALYAYARDTGQHIQDSGPNSGRAHFNLYKFFMISWKRTDVPELQKPKKKSAEETH